MLGVDSPEKRADDVWEQVIDNDYSYAEEEAVKALPEDATEEQKEEARTGARDKCVNEECAEADRKYRDAIRIVAENLFAEHDLCLTEVEKEGEESYFTVSPKVKGYNGWYRAAQHIITTINGVGMFGFSSPRELKDSGPYESMPDAVMQHIHWIADYPEVYEGTKARSLVDSYLRRH